MRELDSEREKGVKRVKLQRFFCVATLHKTEVVWNDGTRVEVSFCDIWTGDVSFRLVSAEAQLIRFQKRQDLLRVPEREKIIVEFDILHFFGYDSFFSVSASLPTPD